MVTTMEGMSFFLFINFFFLCVSVPWSHDW